jgi:chemotaxis protein CheX
MQPEFEIECYRADLSSVVVDVFRTMLDMEVEPQASGQPQSAGSVTATVHFVGEWKGAVLLQITSQQACTLAARLIPVRLPAEFDDDVRDAMGELANMIAGNLKPVLPRGVALSMPSVIEGSDYAVRICGGNLAKSVRFSSVAGDFLVTLVEMLEK